MMNELVIATHNPSKLQEFQNMMQKLPVKLRWLEEFPEIEPPEETGQTFGENARLKAIYYAKKIGIHCLADDSGLEVRSLKGEPGVRSARYAGENATDAANNALLLQNMKFQVQRRCRFVCALALASPKGKIFTESEGYCDGMLLYTPLGELGFGYDPLFWSNDLHKTLAEATEEEKNTYSHRAQALKKLVTRWRNFK